jgi:hypothetical protein
MAEAQQAMPEGAPEAKGPVGTGLFFLDRRSQTDGVVVATRWLTILFLPLFPIGSVRIDAVSGAPLEHSQTKLARVAATYLWGLLCVFLAAAPLTYAFWFVHETGVVEAVRLLAGIVWLLLVGLWLDGQAMRAPIRLGGRSRSMGSPASHPSSR